MSLIIGGRPYCVMFDSRIPSSGPELQTWLETTGAYMGAWGNAVAANQLGVRFVGRHTRGPYTRLAFADRAQLKGVELDAAHNWGDWAALVPKLWEGRYRNAGDPERDAMYEGVRASWPYRLIAAFMDVYGKVPDGMFIDADVPGFESALADLAALLHSNGCRMYLNGGRFRTLGWDFLKRFDGLFYEAVQVGTADEEVSRRNAEALLESLAGQPQYWCGIQVRFRDVPTEAQIDSEAAWFLRARRNGAQTVTLRYQPPSGQGAYDLPCPRALHPANVVHTNPLMVPVSVAPPPVPRGSVGPAPQ